MDNTQANELKITIDNPDSPNYEWFKYTMSRKNFVFMFVTYVSSYVSVYCFVASKTLITINSTNLFSLSIVLLILALSTVLLLVFLIYLTISDTHQIESNITVIKLVITIIQVFVSIVLCVGHTLEHSAEFAFGLHVSVLISVIIVIFVIFDKLDKYHN